MWQQWVNLIIGLWIVLSGYLNLGPVASATNLTIAGGLIVILAIWGGAEYRAHEHGHTHQHA